MFCPNCGSKNSTGQKFCRSCGLNLEKVAESLLEQLPIRMEESIERRRGRVETLGVVASWLFVAVALGFSLYQIVFRMILAGGKVLPGVALLVLLICGILSVVFFNYANSLKAAAARRRLRQLTEREKTATKLLQEPHMEPIPSVTERTTELLYTERKGDTESNSR